METVDLTILKILGGIVTFLFSAGSVWLGMIYRRLGSIDRHIKAFLVLQGATEAKLDAHEKRIDRLESRVFDS